jgi:ComF family protein
MLHSILDGLKQVLYPDLPECSFCNAHLTLYEDLICDSCRTKIANTTKGYTRCIKCGKLLNGKTICSVCENKKLPFITARAVGGYDGLLKELLHSYKYRGKRSLAYPFARLMALETLKDVNYLNSDCITFVPLTKERLKDRGFNQSQLLAEELGKYLRIPVKSLLKKTVETVPMVKLSRDERLNNLAGAFQVENNINRLNLRRIILVDDVFTTGSTVTVCCQELKKTLNLQIFVLTLATGYEYLS